VGLRATTGNMNGSSFYPVGPKGLSHVSVRAIAEMGEGGVWVATEAGLDHVFG